MLVAVSRLELGIAGDVDGTQIEAEARRRRLEDRLGVVAQLAVRRAVDDDLDGVRHPLTVNGSTRSLVTESTEVASTTRRYAPGASGEPESPRPVTPKR